jgi:hypothetical protein
MTKSMSVEEIARTMALAFNTLGHAAIPSESWEALRQRVGDEKLRRDFEESASKCLELARFSRTGVNAATFPRASEAEVALVRMLELLPSMSMEDVQAVAELRACARRMFESLGIPLPK